VLNYLPTMAFSIGAKDKGLYPKRFSFFFYFNVELYKITSNLSEETVVVHYSKSNT